MSSIDRIIQLKQQEINQILSKYQIGELQIPNIFELLFKRKENSKFKIFQNENVENPDSRIITGALLKDVVGEYYIYEVKQIQTCIHENSKSNSLWNVHENIAEELLNSHTYFVAIHRDIEISQAVQAIFQVATHDPLILKVDKHNDGQLEVQRVNNLSILFESITPLPLPQQ